MFDSYQHAFSNAPTTESLAIIIIAVVMVIWFILVLFYSKRTFINLSLALVIAILTVALCLFELERTASRQGAGSQESGSSNNADERSNQAHTGAE